MRRQENLTLNGEIEMMMAVSNLLLPIAHLSEISKKCNFSETKTEKIRFQSMIQLSDIELAKLCKI